MQFLPKWIGRLLKQRKARALAHVILPRYGLVFFNQLIGEYDSVPSRQTRDQEAEGEARVLKDIYLNKTRDLTWGDLYAFERLLLRLRTLPELRERLWAIEARYRQNTSESAYNEHIKSAPIDPATAPEDILRARIEVLLRELYRLYMVTACREDMRKRASKIITGGMLVFVAVFFIPQIVTDLRSGALVHIRTLTAVLAAGALGGFISAQRRVQSISNRGESMLDLIELSNGTGTFLAPTTGAVFAAVLFLLFAGQFLMGRLFPVINTPLEKVPAGMVFGVFAMGTGPNQGIDWAKLMVWSFIAGFAERFVPGALDRMVNRTEKNDGTTRSA
jgi:hypothetical protein